MMVVWIAVGVGALLLLSVLGYGLFGQGKRLKGAISDAQTAVGPQVAELARGIQRAQALRMQDVSDKTHGHGRHA